MSPNTIDLIAEQEGILHVLDAKKYDLVDELGYHDILMSNLNKATDRKSSDDEVPMVYFVTQFSVQRSDRFL